MISNRTIPKRYYFALTQRPSSQRWLQRQRHDPYVHQAQRDGYRSRAAYKLLELDQKERLLRPGMRVVDLGAAPGGWCQVAQQRVGSSGYVVGLDILPIAPLPGVRLIQGDFSAPNVVSALQAALEQRPADVVLSDMLPNVTGVAAVDQPRAMYLCELALELCDRLLKPQGDLVVKVFQGEGFDEYLRTLRRAFRRVASRKPPASRPASREMYLIARGFTGSLLTNAPANS